MRRLGFVCVAWILLALPAHAELGRDIAEHRIEILRELDTLLRLPNVASDLPNIRRNAELLVQMLEARGATAELLELSPDVPPAVLGELSSPGATRTIVLYAHYDGQPVELDRWVTPPWQPTLRDGPDLASSSVVGLDGLRGDAHGDEWRLFARSASDDKGPIVAMLAALDALERLGIERSVNLKFFFEGEEEAGSPNLRPMLEKHRERLDADLWLFCDGPKHPSRRQQAVFGVRGVVGLHLTTYGATRPLHSGHYGNWSPNPAAELVQLLAGMRAADGAITVDGIAEHVRALGEVDRHAIASAPDVGDAQRHELGLARSEGDGAPILERILQPALNVRGIAAGSTGAAAKNAIPDTATATLGFRLVPDVTPEIVKAAVERHLTRLGYHIVRGDPEMATRRAHGRIVKLEWEGGYRGLRTPIDDPASRALLSVLDRMQVEPVIRVPILGGSLPLYIFEETLGTPLIVLPMVNHDNSQHAPNENLRLADLWSGVELYATMIAELGGTWPR